MKQNRIEIKIKEKKNWNIFIAVALQQKKDLHKLYSKTPLNAGHMF